MLAVPSHRTTPVRTVSSAGHLRPDVLHELMIGLRLVRCAVDELMKRATKANSVSRLMVACRDMFEGWRQALEVILLECWDPHAPHSSVAMGQYEVVVFSIINTLTQVPQPARTRVLSPSRGGMRYLMCPIP